MLPFLMLPAVILTLPAAPVPGAVQVHARIWVLRTAPGPETWAALKSAGITHVINLRRDGEPGFDPEQENTELMSREITYVRLAMGRTPAASDLDLFRTVLAGLPSNARILVHCGNGNRAAAAMCSALVLDYKMEEGKALALAREAGLSAPETEKALLAYLARLRG